MLDSGSSPSLIYEFCIKNYWTKTKINKTKLLSGNKYGFAFHKFRQLKILYFFVKCTLTMIIWMKKTAMFYADFTAADVRKGPWVSWTSTLASVISEFKTRGRQDFTQSADRNSSTLSRRCSGWPPEIPFHAHFHDSIRRTAVTVKNFQFTESWT